MRYIYPGFALWYKEAYNKLFPCMEATYPYAIRTQRKARRGLELVLYGIRELASATYCVEVTVGERLHFYFYPRQECQTIDNQKCDLIPREDCQDVPRQQCTTVSRENCRTVPRQKCRQVPGQRCRANPR